MKSSVLITGVLIGSAMAVFVAAFALDKAAPQPMSGAIHMSSFPELAALSGVPSERELRALDGAGEWINSQPLTASDLRGKVVLVQFWTYTCINWLRAEPYVRAWSEKYRDQGLVVIGVHSPEFSFEHKIENVRRAAKDLHVAYPIAVDNDFRIWRALRNYAWPALYFIDAQGHVRHRHLGEGDYEQSERTIQMLLAEAGHRPPSHELVSVEGRGAEAAADWNNLKSPEMYLGYQRTDNFSSPGGAARDKRRVYTAPARLRLNHWALAGDWTMGKEATRLNEPNGRIVYRFHARDVHLVMGSAMPGSSIRFRVLVDGRPPSTAFGDDVDNEGYGTITEQRLYQLVRQREPIASRLVEIEFIDRGVELFAFTFG